MNWHFLQFSICCRLGIFFTIQNSLSWAALMIGTSAIEFSFSKKITTDLKQEHIYLSIFESFILLQRTIAKQKIWNKIFRLLFVGPKIGKIVLDIVKGKQICWGVSLNFFKFKTFKSVAGSKNVKIYLVNYTVELQSKFSEAQHQVKKQHFKEKFSN